MIRLTTVLLTLGVSMATAATALAQGQDGAFTALVTPKRHGVGFYAGTTHNNKMFAANGHRDDPTAIKLKPGCAFLAASPPPLI